MNYRYIILLSPDYPYLPYFCVDEFIKNHIPPHKRLYKIFRGIPPEYLPDLLGIQGVSVVGVELGREGDRTKVTLDLERKPKEYVCSKCGRKVKKAIPYRQRTSPTSYPLASFDLPEIYAVSSYLP